MRLARVLFPVVVAGVVSVPLSARQRDFSAVEIETQRVAEGVYMLTGSGGNIGLSIGEDGPFVIDDQFAPLTEKIQAAIAELTSGVVRFVLNTHWHGDHTGGNENFGKAGAMIVAHENVRKRMNPEEFREVMGNTNQAPPDALPVVTFTDAVNLYWNGDNIRVFHVDPAHTDGDAIVYFTNANTFHMGDTFFQGRYPFIDVNSGGHVDGVIAAADRVLSMVDSNSKIIPGHGALSGPDDLRDYRNMLITVRDRIRVMVNEGLTADQIVAATPTADLDDTWGSSPDRFVRNVALSLGAQEAPGPTIPGIQ
ncbi:MAG: MBL fold metallo-hydrolase [Gemmatimonadetes bacterium]|nr:MBL fold metallo-hydrolase [Gemmatimonadota bacterium]